MKKHTNMTKMCMFHTILMKSFILYNPREHRLEDL